MYFNSNMYQHFLRLLVISCTLPLAYFTVIRKDDNKASQEAKGKTFRLNNNLKMPITDDSVIITNNQKLMEVDFLFKNGKLDSNIENIVSILENLNDKTNSKDVEVLWRLGKAYYFYADIKKDNSFIEKGVQLCEKALQLNDKIANSHKWYAKLITWNVSEKTISDQINAGNLYKNHVEKALELNEKDSILYFMLGEYYFKLSEVPSYQRFLASFIFDTLPYGSYEDAVKYLLKADNINPFLKHVKLYLAKSYINLHDNDLAKKYIFEANDLIDANIFLDQSDEFHFNQSEIDNEIKSLFEQFFEK